MDDSDSPGTREACHHYTVTVMSDCDESGKSNNTAT